MKRLGWVIKRTDGSYVDKTGSEYTEDLGKAMIYDDATEPKREINALQTFDEEAIPVMVTVEEMKGA